MPDKGDGSSLLQALKSGKGKTITGKPVDDVSRGTGGQSELLQALNNGAGNTISGSAKGNDTPNARSIQEGATGRPDDDAKNSLSFANSIARQYLGSGYDTPVEVPNAPKPGQSLVNTNVSVQDKSVRMEDVGSARNSMKEEIDGVTKYVQGFLDSYSEPLKNYLVPGTGVNGQRIGDNSSVYGQLSSNNYLQRVLNTNGDVSAIKSFANTGREVLNNDYQQKRKDIEARYPQRAVLLSAGSGVETLVRENEAAYKKDITELETGHQNQLRDFDNAVNSLAAIKVVNESLTNNKRIQDLNVNDIGIAFRDAISDYSDTNKRKAKNGKITPEERVQNQLLGYRALQYKMMESFASGDDVTAKELSGIVNDYQKKVLDDNPEFRKNQLVRAVSSQVYKDMNPIFKSITGYKPSKKDIQKAGEELGLRKEDIDSITSDDIGRVSGFVGNAVNSFVKNTSAPIYEFLARRVYPNLGVSESAINERFDADWYDNHAIGKFLGGAQPESKSLFEGDTKIDTNPSSTNYLMDIANNNSGNLNTDIGAITSVIADGLGQISSFAYGGSQLGKVAKAAKLTTDVEKANRIGLSAWTYITRYDDNYKQATSALGDDKDETKRRLLANVYTLSDILGEQILPDTKIANKIFGGTSAGGDFIKMVKDEGIKAFSRDKAQKLFVRGVKEGIKDWGKEITEDELSLAGNAFGDMLFAPGKYEETDYQKEALQTAVTSAIASAIPTISGGYNSVQRPNSFKRNMLYEVGVNPAPYIAEIDKLVDDGTMSKQEGDERKEVANSLSNIITNNVPDISPETGEKLSRKQKVDYANNLMQEAIMLRKKTNVVDKVGLEYLDHYAGILEQERRDILKGKEVSEDEPVISVESVNTESGNANNGSPAQVTQAANNVSPAPVQQQQVTQPVSQEQTNNDTNVSSLSFEEEPEFVNTTKTKEVAVNNDAGSIVVNDFEQGNDKSVPASDKEVSRAFFDRKLTPQEVSETNKVSPDIRKRFNEADKYVGRQDTRVVANGQKFKGRYILTTAEAITPSHNPETFTSTDGFPMLEDGQNPNDRNYNLAVNRDRVIDRGGRYDGRAAENIPTVDKNGIVIDGNDRAMSGILAARQGTDSEYLSVLKDKADLYGFPSELIDKMVSEGKHPRVVFVSDKVHPYSTELFAAFNPKSTGKIKTQVEEAIQYKRTVPISFYKRLGDIMSEYDSVADFYKSKTSSKEAKDVLLKSGILTPDTLTGHYDLANQKFTTAGRTLLQNILLGRVLGEDGLNLIESNRGYKEKIGFAMNNLISIEALGEDYSLEEYLTSAMRLEDRLQDYITTAGLQDMPKGDAMVQYLSQGALFNEGVNDMSLMFWEVLENPSKTKLREETKKYYEGAKRAKDSGKGENLFGEVTPEREQLLKDNVQLNSEYGRYTGLAQNATGNTQTDTQSGDNTVNQQQDAGGDTNNETPATNKENTGKQQEIVEPTNAKEAVDNIEEQPEAEKIISESEPTVKEQSAIDKAVEEVNKFKNFIAAKERKIELMEQNGDVGTEKYLREQAFLKDYQAKYKLAKRAYDKLNAKGIADTIRSFKVDVTKGGNLYSSVLPIISSVKVYNAAVEVVASALEAGVNIKVAIQNGVDYINENWFTSWNEQKFRDELGENMSFPLSAEEIRTKKLSEGGLSDKNRMSADVLINDVQQDKDSLNGIIDKINAISSISPQTKDKILKYIRSQVKKNVFEADGRKWANDAIADNFEDYDAALEDLGRRVDEYLLNATNDGIRENIRAKYAAATAFVYSEKTKDAVNRGDIIPVSTVDSDGQVDGFILPDRRGSDIFREYAQDKYARLEEAQRNSTIPITQETDAVTAFRLKKSKAWNEIEKIREYLGNTDIKKGSFYGRLKEAGVDINKFGLYLYARHAGERNAYNAEYRQKRFDAKVQDLTSKLEKAGKNKEKFKEINAELDDLLSQRNKDYVLMADGGSGMTNQQAQDILDEVEKDGMRETFEKFEQEFRANVVDKIIDYKYESGFIDDVSYNHLKTYYKHYIPLKVDIDHALEIQDNVTAGMEGDTSNKLKTEQGVLGKIAERVGVKRKSTGKDKYISDTQTNGRDLYRSKGAVDRKYTERFNPILQAQYDLENAIMMAENNKANIVLANLAALNENENIWELKQAEYDIYEDNEGNVFSAKEKNRPQSAVVYYKDGKKNYVILHDKGLQNAFRKVGNAKFDRMVSWPSRMVTQFATLANPEFILANPMIDTQDAYLSLRIQDPKVEKNYLKHVKSIFKVAGSIATGKGEEWNKWLEDWKEQGGNVTFVDMIDIKAQTEKSSKIYDQYGKKVTTAQLRHFTNVMKATTTALEQATRLIAYRSAVEAGIPKDKAAVISRNATVDFEKKGVYGTYINAFKAFANAGTQGLANLAYGAIKSQRVRKFIGAMVVAGMAEAALNDLLGDCDKNPENCYWEIPEWQKSRNWLIRNPFGEGYVNLRVGRQFGFFNYLGKTLYGLGAGKVDFGEFISNTISTLMSFYNPVGGDSPIGQQFAGNFAPVVQWVYNENSFGAPIVPENYLGVPEHENAYPKTPSAFKEAANLLSKASGGSDTEDGAIEISPEKLEFLFETAFSGVYNFTSDAITSGYSMAKGEETQIKDIPIARIFFRESNMAKTKEKYFNFADESAKKVFTDEENTELKNTLDRLVEHGQITPEVRKKRLSYIKGNQKKLKKQRKPKKGGGSVDPNVI